MTCSAFFPGVNQDLKLKGSCQPGPTLHRLWSEADHISEGLEELCLEGSSESETIPPSDDSYVAF